MCTLMMSDQSDPADTFHNGHDLHTFNAVQIGLLPGYHVGMGNGGLGCFTPSHGLTRVSTNPNCCAACLSSGFKIQQTSG